MSDQDQDAVLYIEHASLRVGTPLASLWSFEARGPEPHRPPVRLNESGSQEYWLQRTDPLLNTLLPGTHVSLVVNFGELWASGWSVASTELLPRVSVIGPVTRAKLLRLGRSVRAVGVVIPPTFTECAFGVSASALVDRIVPLADLWPPAEVDRLLVADPTMLIEHQVAAMRDRLLSHLVRSSSIDPVAQICVGQIEDQEGRVSVQGLARSHGLRRQVFTERFLNETGLPPKLFARLTRFQSLVQKLLATDVTRWASVSWGLGFYDQAHMIKEFHAFAGSAPTLFFQPRDAIASGKKRRLKGRPSQWGV